MGEVSVAARPSADVQEDGWKRRLNRYSLGGRQTTPVRTPGRRAMSNEYAEYAAPLREEVGRLKERLEAIDAERTELRTKITRLEGAVERLDPTPGRKKPGRQPVASGRGGSYQSMEKSTTDVREYLDKHAKELDNGFGSADIYRGLRANGNAVIGRARVRDILVEMHSQGEIRLDRRGMGGSLI